MPEHTLLVEKSGSFLSNPYAADRNSEELQQKRRDAARIAKLSTDKSFARYIISAKAENGELQFRVAIEEALVADGTQLDSDLYIYNTSAAYDLEQIRAKINAAFGNIAPFCSLAQDDVHGSHLRVQLSQIHTYVIKHLWRVLEDSATLNLSSTVTLFLDRVRYPLLVSAEIKEAFLRIVGFRSQGDLDAVRNYAAYKQRELDFDFSSFIATISQHSHEALAPLVEPIPSPRALLLSRGWARVSAPSPFEEPLASPLVRFSRSTSDTSTTASRDERKRSDSSAGLSPRAERGKRARANSITIVG